MAWSWDSAAKVEATASGSSNNDVQVDMNVGTTADNRLLLSTAGSEDDRGGMDISTTWTYNGVNMTKPSTYRVEAATGYANVAMMAYMNDSALPTDGLAHPLRAVFDNPSNGLGSPYFELSGHLYHGVKQAAPTDVQTVSNTSATSVTTPTITVASAGSLVVGAAQFWDYSAWNDVTGQNERSDFGITTTQHLVTDKSADTNTTLTADNSGGSGRICLIAASWEQASSAAVIAPSGIASAEAIGSHTVNPGPVTVSPTGIASAEALGSPTLAAVLYIQPGGIPSGEAIGNASLSGILVLYPAGIQSAEAFGSATLQGGTLYIVPGGIPSGEAVSSAAVIAGPVTLVPAGIASGESVGFHQVGQQAQGEEKRWFVIQHGKILGTLNMKAKVLAGRGKKIPY